MDPNANLAEQLRLAERITDAADSDGERPVSAEDAARLAELVLALDKWLSDRGTLPERWQ